MRVLHIGKYFPPYAGGMEVFLADLAAAQRTAGDDVMVLVHGTPEADDPPWLVRVPVWFNLAYAPVAPRFPFTLARLLREFRPDVLHLHMPNPSAFAVLALRRAARIPWVVHWHSDVVVGHGGRALAAAYRLYRPWERALLARAARIVATSPPYLEASAALAPWRDKCEVVPLGMDPARYPPPAEESAAPWASGRFRVLGLGRLSHYKDFATLVRAVSGMDGVELLLAGDGEQRALLDDLAASSGGRVRLLGSVSEAHKRSLLASCDVLCLPSIERSEAFGVVLLEAMHYGKPCIASDLPGSGMGWVVARAGGGRLAPPGDPQAWRAAITALREDPQGARSLGHAGMRAVAREFAIAPCAALLRKTYGRAGVSADPVPVTRGPLVVIPARDEALTIGTVVGGLRAAGWQDVVVVDDGSGDGTGDIAARAGATVLRAPLRLGAWGAMQAGIRHAIERGHESVITMDADGQHEVAELPRLLADADAADLVIGAHPARASRARRVAWHWFRQLTGLGLEDLTSGFRYYGRRAMHLAVSEEAALLDFQDIGVLLLMRRAGLRIAEVPVAMSPRVADRSRVFDSWLTVARYMAMTTLLCLARRPYRSMRGRTN